MDDFKVACIFVKVEFVGYMSNMCTVRLRLELSCNMVGLGIEFGSYFVSLGPINMRALPCNRETTWVAGVGGGVAAVVPGCQCSCCLWGGVPVVMLRGCRCIAEPR